MYVRFVQTEMGWELYGDQWPFALMKAGEPLHREVFVLQGCTPGNFKVMFWDKGRGPLPGYWTPLQVQYWWRMLVGQCMPWTLPAGKALDWNKLTGMLDVKFSNE